MDEAYWRALTVGDRHAALAEVKRLREAGRTPVEIVEEVIVPAQERMGRQWLAGAWTSEQEETATAISEGLVHWLGSFTPDPDPGAPLVLVSCVEGERHSLPALVVAEALRDAGYRVEYSGGDPDPADLLRRVLVLRPRAVLFSASLTSSLAAQKGLFGSISSTGIPVLVGGRAFGGDERRARALGATAYAGSVAEVVHLLETLPRRLPEAARPEDGPSDAEAAWILAFRDRIAHLVVRTLERRHPAEGERPHWWAELEGHVQHVLGCLASALVTGDETIMVEVRDWLGQVVTRRGGDAGLVAEVWELLAEPLRGHPLARVYLAGSATPAGDSGAAV